ncbi:peptidoglycan endopeptidase, partial [Dickeya dianthicola]|nr:peptidoglycan endopeptidase [Dickeya dianthicola]
MPLSPVAPVALPPPTDGVVLPPPPPPTDGVVLPPPLLL